MAAISFYISAGPLKEETTLSVSAHIWGQFIVHPIC